MKFTSRLLASTVVPIAIAIGISIAVPARANPCAAKNPCGAARGNPAAAKSPCNPCAAKAPCSPCGGAAAATRCVVPRLNAAAAANPCAAKRPCSPSAAKNPCNPCAAKNPCNPCSASPAVELTDAEANAVYDCILSDMKAAYAKAGMPVAKNYAEWQRYNRVAYQSATHGNRFVNNYANDAGKAYGKFEKAGKMPPGAYLVKDSFTVSADGKAAVGPLFIMRKMAAGFNRASQNWKYSMVMPDGSVFGETNGKNAEGMKFCYECHAIVPPEQDSMYFMPAEVRRK